jgi:hypothetical protein
MLGVLFVVGLVIEYIWWFVGGAVLVGLFFAGRALFRQLEKERQLEAEQEADREFEMTRRAERQRRWTLMGDERAIYGEDGAAARRKVAEDDDEAAYEDSPIAQLATTPTQLKALIREKPQGWPQALFGSVLVQRLDPLQARMRDAELGFMTPNRFGTMSARNLASEVVGLVDEMMATEQQVHGFMAAPAFMGAFAGPDPEAIKHIANRTMDFCERFLELSERCRALSVRSDQVDIVTDCAHILNGPLQSYREFIGDFVDVVNALPRVLQHASGTVDMGSLALYLSVDDKRYARMLKRLDAITGA